MSAKAFFKRLFAPGLDYLKNSKDVAGLERLLADPDYGELRFRAAEALGSIADIKAAVVLGRFIDDKTIGKVAANALAFIAEQDRSALAAAFKEQQTDICKRCSALLLQAGSPLRAAAASALAQIATPQAASSLVGTLISDAESPIRSVLLSSLTEVANVNPQLIVGALPEKESLQDEALLNVIAACKNADKTDALLSVATNSSDRRRRLLGVALVHINDAKALKQAYVRTKHAPVRQLAAAALRELGGESAIDVLLDDVDDRNRQDEAVTRLGQIGKGCIPTVVQRIARRKGDKEPLYKVLRKIGQTAAASLLELVAQEPVSECDNSLTTLCKLFPESAVTGLRRLVANTKGRQLDYEKGNLVISALKELGWRPETPQEKAWAAAIANDWAQCAAFGDDGIPALIAARNATSSSVRDAANSVLSKMSGAIVRVLTDQLQKEDTRLQAIEDLKNYPSAETLDLMIDAVTKWSHKDLPIAFRAALHVLSAGVADSSKQRAIAEIMAGRLMASAVEWIEQLLSMEFTFLSDGSSHLLGILDELRDELRDTIRKRDITVDSKCKEFLATSILGLYRELKQKKRRRA